MLFRFSIEYHTRWGEEIRIQFGKSEYTMTTIDGKTWSCELHLSPVGDTLIYNYALYRNGEFVLKEWKQSPHKVYVSKEFHPKKTTDIEPTFTVEDLWVDIPDILPLYSSAFTDIIGYHKEEHPSTLPHYSNTLILHVSEPRLTKDQTLGISGNLSILGNWEKGISMHSIGNQEWELTIDLDSLFRPLEYKYVILDKDGEIMSWEEGGNRYIDRIMISGTNHCWQKTDSPPRFDIERWKCAGIVIPVFSLRTERSYGVGDFGDLKEMIVWASSLGMHAVQILPINDTMMSGSWQDSYPYNSISIYAFHPLYADLNSLPSLSDGLEMEKFKILQQEMNRSPEMDYEACIRLKMDYFRSVFQEDWERVRSSSDYKTFFESNKLWLIPYAAFSYLRDTYGTPDFRVWPKYSTYNASEISRLCSSRSKHYSEICLYYYIQYQLHLQLVSVHECAKSNGVIIKGDIPIGISRNSVEAWSEPHYFNMDSYAGAPPDAFSTNGQNWGFPTYNWDEMSQDGYSWWKRRFTKMSEYFDAYRIDHVLGFFRIWQIPSHSVHGLLGHFSPSLPMSQSEIESYGFHFNRKTMTSPYINDDILYELFGYRADMVKMLYLDNVEMSQDMLAMNSFGGLNGLYKLKDEYDTQRKIESSFLGKNTPDDIILRDGLYRLVSNVLFVIDSDSPHGYHPRIIASEDFAYRYLPESDRKAFDRLYEDYYYHRHNDFWYNEAMKKLPMLTQCTRMLVCAEDLGMVPACVPVLMSDLRILSLEIQSMPKAFGLEFGNLSENPYLSVSTISTHDMSTLRQWWEEDPERTQRYYNHSLQIDGRAPEELPGWLAEKIVSRHLYSPSMLCLLSFQDWLSIDEGLRNPDANGERINIPSNPRHYWRWRMHLTIRELASKKEFCEHVKELIRRSGR